MGHSRRTAVMMLLGPALTASGAQGPPDDDQQHRLHLPNPNEDQKLPNGKSQKDAIATAEHQQAMKDAEQLVALATDIRNELQKAGSYVVPLSTVKKTEDIEKLARHIRSRLKT